MAKCCECGRKLGFFKFKQEFTDGTFMCKSCHKIWKEEKSKKDFEDITNLVRRYLKNKDFEFYGAVLRTVMTISENKQLYDMLNDDLDKLRNYYAFSLQSAKKANKRGIGSSELDEISSNINTYEIILEFFDDFEKINRILLKRDIDILYTDLLNIFSTEIEMNIDQFLYENIVNPLFVIISKKLEKENITKENVIKEFLKTPFSTASGLFIPKVIEKIFDRFKIKFEMDEVDDLVEEMRDELELENFEKHLGSEKKIKLEDFNSLDGYEFEGYLERVFKYIGYAVIKTPLSGDQGADLILTKDGEKTVVQAKKYEGKVSNKAVQEIVASMKYYHADKSMIVTNSSFTQSAMNLALRNDVALWDGEKLKCEIKKLRDRSKNEEIFSSSYTIKFEKGKYIYTIKPSCPLCSESLQPITIDTREGIKDFETVCKNCGKVSLKLKTTDKIWKCDFCPETFETQEETEEHERKFHRKGL